MYGKDYPYAQTRIQGTVLRLLENGEPVYIYHVMNDGTCFCIPIEKDWSDMQNAVQYHIDAIDMHPVPLGYVNCAGEATYLMRIPMRRDWKQGLRQENCWSSGRRLSEIPMKDVRNCIMNKYPSFNSCVKGVQTGISRGRQKVIAWHRSWALKTNGSVLYKNHEVVGGLDGSGNVCLHNQYKYLKEALQESLQ